jgi:peptide/nickel transport system ATP-binding protein
MSESRQPSARGEVPFLRFDGVSKIYKKSRRAAETVAVDAVSFTLPPGTALGLVGGSGSGKSTIAKLILGSETPTSGSVRFGDLRVDALGRSARRRYHSKVQMVFQDPYGALNPVHTIEYALTRPLVNFLGMTKAQAHDRVYDLLETVGLSPARQFAEKMPHQLSGGQRQRVVIARALACEPELIVADEPVSMLDVSMRAGVLRLLARLREERGLSLLYITHDLLSARVVTDHLLVLHRGRIVESGETVDVLRHPKDPYTVALLDAIPNPFADVGTTAD